MISLFVGYAIKHLLKGEYDKALWFIQCLINSQDETHNAP